MSDAANLPLPGGERAGVRGLEVGDSPPSPSPLAQPSPRLGEGSSTRPLDHVADFPAIPDGWSYLDTAATAQ
ncbi:MAG TPA: hypothetical protein VEA61_16170, partial [Allosphingosinicella sp.]|nr:hypothetical protein [Allosphingosinicella sp.]